MIFNENNKAIYLQIADKICDDIMLGTLNEGDRIPSVREYAASLEVNANTVMRSYEFLERNGIIFNRRGIGFFIEKEAAETIRKMRKETFFSGECDYFFRQLMTLGISPEELTQLFKKYLTENKK